MNPLVSVVIPTRNRPALVTSAVESVLAQSYRHIEVTVVLDGPDPVTLAALEILRASDNRLHILPLDTNGGGCRARNRGIAASNGRWIALLDDDDEWLPEKIERQIAALAELDLEPCAPILATHLYAVAAEGDQKVWPTSDLREPLSEYLYCRSSFAYGEGVLQTSSLMAPRSLFLACPFNEDLRNYEDDDWILRASRQPGACLRLLPEPLIRWRVWQDSNSASNRANWRRTLDWIRRSRSLVTRRAYASFIATNVAREACNQSAWGQLPFLLIEMIRHGRPRLFDYALFFASWVPGKFRRQFVTLFRSSL